MGKLYLVWSPVQLRLANQPKMSPIGRVPRLPIEVERLNTYEKFDFIEIVYEISLYPALLGIG